jgi:hypothetical protein
MRVIKFRPLRLIKKTNKVVVATYMEWNKLRCANKFVVATYMEWNKLRCENYNSLFYLQLDQEYKKFDPAQYVHNHKGELLYFYDVDISSLPPKWEEYSWQCKGFDVSGTPTFSHFTAEYIVDIYEKTFDQFEPLTVGTVRKVFEWFIYQLDNARTLPLHPTNPTNNSA